MFNAFNQGQGRNRLLPDSVIEQMAHIQVNAATPFLQMALPSDEERVRYLDSLIDGLDRLRGDMERRPVGRDYYDDDRRDRSPPPRGRNGGGRHRYHDED